MNERLITMLAMVKIRDQVSVTILVMASVLLAGALLLSVAPWSARIRDRLLQIYGGLALVAWISWLVILTAAGGMQ